MNIPDDYLARVFNALEHYVAYLKATQRDEQLYQEVLDFLKRKGPGKEEPEPAKKKRG